MCNLKKKVNNPEVCIVVMFLSLKVRSCCPGWLAVFRAPHHHGWGHIRHVTDQRGHRECE